MHRFYSFLKKQQMLWCLLFVGMYLTGCNRTGEEFVLTDTGQEMTAEESAEVSQDAVMQETEQAEQTGVVVVFVCGQVAMPGVYELPEGSRIYDAVMQAGGCLASADSCAVNQAKCLEDGMQIYIPAVGEVCEELSPEGTQTASDGKISINRADRAELLKLPGIGESKADAILEYRQTHGEFSNVEELMNVPGIKEGIFTKLQDYITVE